MNNNLGEKMIKLTDKENKLVQVLLDNNDDTDCQAYQHSGNTIQDLKPKIIPGYGPKPVESENK